MERLVEMQFTETVLTEILKRFNLTPDYQKLGDFENYVFEVYDQNHTPKILRVTHHSHRSKEELESELDWIQYLCNCGIKIPNVITSPVGNTVEAFEANQSYFFASLFEKALGQPVKVDGPSFNEKLFYKWGKTIGRIHKYTKDYLRTPGIVQRAQWDENDLLDLDKYYIGEDALLLGKVNKVIENIKELPKERNSFGLIHTDIHHGNFFYDGEMIQVFDFDDASYQYFVSDIAIPLYYATNSKHFYGTREERNQFAQKFLHAFLDGYDEENHLTREWLTTLPLFLKLRDIDLYAVFNKKVAPEDRNERVLHWLKEIRERIENEVAIVDISFT
ncbi:phosphotransferase [Heyndrickxia oleronia]|uniref:phosphotransferase enzyme family protein n=1 Tax=Heyndrickxia oleronia TaxID=38875 RepID=UPI00203AA20D|nr:phosphotransferase [Heyndrickxia oleronia]MCM3454348.1 phosphotransferase [Heyndrickxia oleronia]